MKKTTIFLAVNLFIIILLFILSEALVRIFYPELQPQGTDKNLFLENAFGKSDGLKPNSAGLSNGVKVAVNQYGFRKFSKKLNPGQKSWLLLGDSVTMGIGVEADSTFAGLLQAKLDSINVLNPSLIGYNIEDYYNVFHHFVVQGEQNLSINQITICWCLNDVYSTIDLVALPGGQLRYLFSNVLSFLRVHSRLYFLLKTLIFDRAESYYLFDAAFYKLENAEFQNSIKRLVEIDRLCRVRKIKFNLVLLPYEYQLRDDLENRFQPQHLMRQALEPYGIEINNPVDPAFDKTPGKRLFLFGDGIHLSNFGHRFVADYMIKSQ